jgi:hypothetical protein
MTDISIRYLFTMALTLGEIQMLGKTPLGDRRVAVIEGGSFEGPKLKGTVLKGGNDWLINRPDGALQLDVRLTLQTDDGHFIGMIYRGYRYGPTAVIDRLNRGEKVDPSEYYFRAAPFFETSSEKYDWLNRIVSVATGHRLPSGPVYDVFEVL